MKKIEMFIDYFPMENGFIIPIFIDENKNYFLQKKESNAVKYIEFNLDGVSDKINEKSKTQLLENKKKAFNYIKTQEIFVEENVFYSAFKFNSDFIIVAPISELIEQLTFGIGTLNGNLSMFDEIIQVIMDNSIDYNKISNNLNQAKDFYKNEYYSKESENVVIKEESNKINEKNTLRYIVEKRELASIDYLDILKRNVHRKSKQKNSVNFDIELSRISIFKKILIEQFMQKESLKKYVSLFEE